MDELGYSVLQLSASGYCCSQIMVKLALDAEENENWDIIKSMQGLCRGIAYTQGTCGVLTGGIAIFGLYAGKGEDTELAKEDFNEMTKEFYEWFEDEQGYIDCRELIGFNRFDGTDMSYQEKCGQLITSSYAKVCDILTEHGYEFGSRE